MFLRRLLELAKPHWSVAWSCASTASFLATIAASLSVVSRLAAIAAATASTAIVKVTCRISESPLSAAWGACSDSSWCSSSSRGESDIGLYSGIVRRRPLQRGPRRGEAGDGDAVGGAADVVEAGGVEGGGRGGGARRLGP